MKRFKVSVRIKRDFERIITAKTEAQAIRKVKEQIAVTIKKIRMKDFDKQCDSAWSE